MNNINNFYKKSNIFLILLILFLILQGFDHSFGWGLNQMIPKVYFTTFGKIDEGWSETIWDENGLIENNGLQLWSAPANSPFDKVRLTTQDVEVLYVKP